MGKVYVVPGSVSFYAARVVMDGRRGVVRIDRRSSGAVGIVHPRRRVPDWLRDAGRDLRRALAPFLCSYRHGTGGGLPRYGPGIADHRRRTSISRSHDRWRTTPLSALAIFDF